MGTSIRILSVVVVLALGTTACGDDGDDASADTTGVTVATSAPVTQTSAVESPIVGSWIGTHDCQAIVDALRNANVPESVVLENVLGNGLVPGASTSADLVDVADPCADAVPREHGHFFTADGAFGSTDFDGNQVDDGRYAVVDNDTLTINGTEFGYIVSGDELTLDSRVADDCLGFVCGWSIMVAMPGQTLQRVP